MVICTLNDAAAEFQPVIIDAAFQAGVKRFLQNEWYEYHFFPFKNFFHNLLNLFSIHFHPLLISAERAKFLSDEIAGQVTI